MTPSTLAQALRTPLPLYRFLSRSRSSIASRFPVEAPDGILAVALTPLDRIAVTASVGFPRESRISRASNLAISDIKFTPLDLDQHMLPTAMSPIHSSCTSVNHHHRTMCVTEHAF